MSAVHVYSSTINLYWFEENRFHCFYPNILCDVFTYFYILCAYFICTHKNKNLNNIQQHACKQASKQTGTYMVHNTEYKQTYACIHCIRSQHILLELQQVSIFFNIFVAVVFGCFIFSVFFSADFRTGARAYTQCFS